MRPRLLVFILVLAVIAPALYARGKKPAPTAPGTYKEWGQDIDKIEIIKTFKISDYDKIIVQPFDTTKAPLPDKKEKWYGTMKSALAATTEWFMEGLQPELKTKADLQQSSNSPKDSKTLIIRGTVDAMDPGSRAGRYFGGFGAGSASTKLSFEVVDAKSGKVLAKVTQERRSAGTWKGGGGSDLDVMRDSVHAIAQDMAHVLDAFV
ncbi:MAG TPA: DUF4410 domain-containing protein [Thermoanaerobaculia bacterium]|nr:DUF4410 domain-containing protein [Thermoanaerobaculia bacterium]